MDKKCKADSAIYLISLLVIAMGVIVRLIAYYYNRSLFLDEAYLASSVIQRGYTGFFHTLDYSQGAPVGFLCLVKTCVYLFGSSEYSLRLISLFTGIGSIALFYIVLKSVFEDRRPYIGTAFFATIPYLIYYSIELKPYMFDGFLTLVSVFVFSLAIKQKIKPWAISLYCSSVLWFSFPAIFTVAAFCIVWVVYSILNKQREAIKTSLITSIVSLISFGLLFGTVYQNLQENQSLHYWDLIRFPLFPHSVAELKVIYQFVVEYFGTFEKGKYFLILISIASITLFSYKKWAFFSAFFIVEIVLLLIASWLGRYGILMRLLIFIIPLHIIFIAVFISNLWLKRNTIAVVLSFVFILINIGSVRYAFPSYVYRKTFEINPILKKLESVNDSVPLYIYAFSIPQYEYKTGYKMGLINIPKYPIEKNNIIYGSEFFNFKYQKPGSWESDIDSAKLNQNSALITSHDKIYILFSMNFPNHRDALIDNLKRSGNVSEVMNVYETRLYLYEKDNLSELSLIQR